MANEHIKDDEKKGENKVLKDLNGASKISVNNPLYKRFCVNECSHLHGIGDSDICVKIDAPNSVCYITFEVKSGKGNKNTGQINMNQLRLWKGEAVVLECSHSPAYDVDYCVFPANWLIRTALLGHKDFKINPLHQGDALMCAQMTPNPKKAQEYFGCSASELKNKIIEAQKSFENDLPVVEIVKKAKQRILDTVEENKKLAEQLVF